MPKESTYEEIMETSKKNSCVYIDLLEHYDLKNIIEEKSQMFNVNKKRKKRKCNNFWKKGWN